jgi:uncharacterized repeat protein (TIGR01451 family)
MNKIIKTISSVMVISALVITGFNAPIVSVASAQSFDFPSFDFPSFDFGSNTTNSNTSTSESSSFTLQSCKITASQTQIQTGGNITLNWNTSGFDVFTLNGQTLNTDDGSIQMTNITQNTTYELVARTADNTADCIAKITITCLPPPPPPGECKLEVTKSVNKSTANVGDTLTYTITVKNTGTADCTGGGVKIEDVVNSKLTYLTQSVSGNLTAGYGNYGVYTAGDRTLRWNGNTLTPNEQGTITWTAKVNTPASCGDFEIPNQAKATAYELNNYGTWAYSQTVKTTIDNDCQEDPAPTCDAFTANPGSLMVGGSSVLSWQTSNATQVTLNNAVVAADGSTTVSPTTNTTYTLTVHGTNNRSVNCSVPVTVSVDPAPTCDAFTANPGSLMVGGSSVLSWQTSNATQVTLNNAVVAADGSTTVSPTTNTTYTLTVFGTQNRSVNCSVPVTVSQDPAPTCDIFTATPNALVVGQSATLAWQTSNATRVAINNGIGDVVADGSMSIAPIANTVYRLTVFGTQNRSVNCEVPVTVSEDPVPVCEFFTASPNNLAAGGGNVNLSWKVLRATNVSISPTIGSVSAEGNRSINVTGSTNFVLTASDADGDQVSCAAPVTVAQDPLLTCKDNVSFTASDYNIDEGEDTTLNWSTSNVDSVSISQINATSLSGSKTVDPRSDITYVLTAKKGNKSVDCPLRIEVDEDGGGGGGGTPTPRCELTISDNQIKRGDEVTLRWNTSNATDVKIKDNHGKTLVDTDKYLSRDKKDYYDGSLKLKPSRDTEYTLTAKRGSKDRTCKVKVDTDDLTVLTDRDQKPLVAGISLTNVPYTGFEAGPMLTILFYTLLIAWALFVTYLVVMRRRPSMNAGSIMTDSLAPSLLSMKQAEEIRPDVFASTVAPVMPVSTLPTNLPTGVTPVIGYGNVVEVHNPVNPHHVTDEVVTTLENRAHAQMALLSSDAIRHFISTTAGTVERNEALDAVIAEAKSSYPLEDGWIVINEARMQSLCDVCQVNEVASHEAPYVPAVVPTGSSSLAEAIVTGNVVAAYEMIGNRPMFALADAASDLDAVVRARRGEHVHVSELLKAEATKLGDEKIKNMIIALTGALDGTYTDEASAVKMAIMKAVKEAA